MPDSRLQAHNFVVFTQGTLAEMTKWNAFCRSQPTPISFMYCIVAGASGSVFVDHGPGFMVRDADGRNPLIKIIDLVKEVTDEDGTL